VPPNKLRVNPARCASCADCLAKICDGVGWEYPVKSEGPAEIAVPGRPVVRLHFVTRYLTFEYLARTGANLALTDIEAQHPNATGP
jgi:hypothetical protein